MIELYGNKIWNSNTPNKYKKVIIASEDSLDNICQELENSGLNYCAYIFNGEAHIAIGRATANNIDKLDIDYQTVIECNSKVYKTNNIIGTTTYDSIEDKLYRKYNTDFAYKIGQRLTEQGILFSGRIYGKTTTITVDKQYADTLNKISAELKEQRASFMSKSEVVQNESPEESKSVNEKISELHFNESQLSALAPSVKFIQTRNDDNLTDNFVSLFSDCTDFYESQLSALAEIYVDTYRSFSDKSLIFADTSRFNDLKQRFVNDNITAKLTENRGYSTTQFEIIREMVTYGMSESVINLLDYTFSIDEMQNFFTAYKNGSYEDLINLIADIKGTTRTDIEGQIEGGTYTPEIPDYDFLSKNLIFHNPSANHFTVMYFNPDSETGGQFVSTDINYNVAWRGNRDFTNDSERFWRYVEITGNQTLSDVGSKFFRESLNYFYSGEQIAEGLTTDTQKLIADVATAEMIKSGELIEPLAVEVENAAPSRAEKAEVTVVNKAEPPTLFDMVESSEQTETSVNDEKAKNYVIEDREAVTGAKTKFQNNITAKLTENRGYSTTQFEIIREMVTYGMSESVINLLDYTFSIDEMQNFFTAYKNGSYEDLINLIADIKGTTRTDIEGQIEGGTYTPEIPDYDFLSKNLIFHNPSANHFTVMYFNPDSETGGQFVSTDINYNVAWRGNRDFTNDSERFWRYVEITGNQTLSDVGSKFFRESLNYFYSGEQIAEGLTTDTQKLIADVATAEMIKSGELIEPLAVEVENAAPSRAEKAEVTVVNKAEPPTLFDMVESSEQTETSVNDEKAKNYVIEDREAVTGAKTKFQNNIAAIKILKQTEAENRAATPEEQGQLFLYSGWGGLANAFESDNDKWKNEYSELKGLLTDEEYTAARSTVLDSFYTDTAIVDSIYEVIRNAGFEDGNILEPAMGVGNFFGRLPEELRDKVNLYGVEKDSLSGRIAQKLYPQADITIDGFENTRFNDNSFDVAIGNIPFGDFSVNDSKYNSKHLKIHDYFFLKSLDKVRDGGIVAFVTSKGTLDKKDSSFRKTLAERADLVGAVRLPNNAFKSAGTEVTADIIFLQKREKKSEIEPSWVHTGQLENGLTVNNYFVEHPEMILGEVVEGNKMFGRTDDTMCVPFNDGRTLSELLSSAVKNINFEYSASAEKLIPVSEHLTAEPLKLRLQSFYRRNGEIYFYGSDKSGKIVNVSADKALGKKLNHERINSFIDIRDTLRELLDVQQYDNKDSEIAQLQEKLNNCYDSFYSKYGLLHSSYNHSLLNSDGAYPLVASLEADFAKDNNLLVKKSDIFTERVNKPTATISHVDTAEEALAVCVAEKGVIDFEYMSQITDVPPEDLKIGLREKGEIFAVPSYTGDEDYEYQTASEYLSGDIYAKLDMAKAYASVNGIYESNVVALKEVLPTPLKAGDIDINLGATWIDKKYYEQFMYEVFETPQSLKSDYVSRFFKSDRIELDYSEYSGRWNITNKRADLSVTTVKTYGASGLSAYQIFESVLNLSEPKVYKDKVDEYGVVERDKNNKPVRVLDVEATQVVQQKANAIRREFKNWIFKDANRRRDIVDTYNRTFNCVHAREYDGSHLNFPGMNSNIQLHEHQKNAIAHAIYGGNTLFAHSVGAGKTFEMIATAMECKRLGLCHKSLFAVPNHLTEQVGADFLKLYPNANILVATKDDFKSSNRKMLMSKIATGNYDAVIIGHTQLKMLPLSPERQEAFLQSQIDDIVAGLAEMKAQDGNKFTVKEMERTKKNLENQLEKLQSSKKDNTVYFEELGIDKLFVDEAHEFKNLYCATKLQNVSGISSRASQRATELFAKCRYLDEKTGGKGVVFATGTPLSNSVTELHTMMRYLNYDFLASHNNMQNFDNWISAFGVQKKEYELAPAGNKFKERTRIAEYSNLPELMSMFKMVADVKTAETLKLKVPDCELHIVDVEPTELQKELVDELSDRADEVNSGSVDPSQDNMLKITGDGRKLGLDPRLISPDFEDDPNTKLNVCVNNVFDIYTDTAKDKLTQIVFCDLGVPSKNTGNDSSKEQNDNKSVEELDSLEETGKFCVYDDIRDKLIAKGIPATEIAYIHNAKTEAQKSELFSKVRSGEVRILLGSTGKMGTGTNVQDRIIALHDLDVPWRPADLEQRRGRMVRQGNINEKVHLYRYVTKGTFDAYSYQLLETKQKFISQVMTDKAPARKCTDVDQAALSYGEIKALCTGDDRIREKLTLDNRVKELNSLKADYNNTKYELEDAVAAYPEKRKQLLCTIGNIKSDIDNVKSFVDKDGKLICKLTLGSQTFNLKNDEERKNAAKALTTAVAQVRIADNRKKQVSVGNICGFDISVINNGNVYDDIVVTIKGKYSYSAQLGVSAVHNLSKIEGLLYKTESVLDYSQNSLNKLDLDYKTSVALLEKPFEYEAELQEKSARLSELTKILNIELAHQKTESKPKTHYFGKDKILGRNKSSKQLQNKTVMKSEPKRSEPEL